MAPSPTVAAACGQISATNRRYDRGRNVEVQKGKPMACWLRLGRRGQRWAAYAHYRSDWHAIRATATVGGLSRQPHTETRLNARRLNAPSSQRRVRALIPDAAQQAHFAEVVAKINRTMLVISTRFLQSGIRSGPNKITSFNADRHLPSFTNSVVDDHPLESRTSIGRKRFRQPGVQQAHVSAIHCRYA